MYAEDETEAGCGTIGFSARTRGLERDHRSHDVAASTQRASALENPAAEAVFATENDARLLAPALRHGEPGVSRGHESTVVKAFFAGYDKATQNVTFARLIFVFIHLH